MSEEGAYQRGAAELDRIRDAFTMLGHTLHEALRRSLKLALAPVDVHSQIMRLTDEILRLQSAVYRLEAAQEDGRKKRGRKSGGRSGKKRRKAARSQADTPRR